MDRHGGQRARWIPDYSLQRSPVDLFRLRQWHNRDRTSFTTTSATGHQRATESPSLSLSLSLYSVYVKERKNVNVFLDANNFRFLFFTVRLKNVPSTVNERRKRGRSVKIVTTERIRLKGREKGKFEIF